MSTQRLRGSHFLLACLLIASIQLHDNISLKKSPFIQLTEGSKIETIRYNERDGIDLYSAFMLPQQPQPKLQPQQRTQQNQRKVSGLKSILPANLIQSPQSGELLAPRPPVPNIKRQAKQIQGFVNSDALERQQQTTSQNVCLTPGCVKAAAEILKNMDEKVDPCDDFYRYSCGNWIDSQVIPEDKTSVSLFSVIQDELDNKLRNLIERPAIEGETPIVNGMRNLYESCMNTCKYRVSLTLSPAPFPQTQVLVTCMRQSE